MAPGATNGPTIFVSTGFRPTYSVLMMTQSLRRGREGDVVANGIVELVVGYDGALGFGKING